MKKRSLTLLLFFTLILPKVFVGQGYSEIDSIAVYENIVQGDDYFYYQPDSALFFYKEALKIANKKDKDALVAASLESIAHYYRDYFFYDESIIYYNKALEKFEKCKDKKGLASVYGNLAIVYHDNGELEEALTYYKHALSINLEIDNIQVVGINYGNIGILYHDQGDLEKAMDFYYKAITVCDRIEDNEGLASNYGNIANIYLDQRNFEQSTEYYNEALSIYEGIKDSVGLSTILGNLGNVYYEQNNLDKALICYNKAMVISTKIDDVYGVAFNLESIGGVYAVQGKHTKARSNFKKSLENYQAIGDKDGEALVLIRIADLYNQVAMYDSAIFYAQSGKAIALEMDFIENKKEAYKILSDAYRGLKNYKKALHYTDLYKVLNDSSFNLASDEAIAEMNARYHTEKKENQIIQQEIAIKNGYLQAEKDKAQRNLWLIAFVLMGLITLVVYYLYKIKDKANVLLNLQKDAIKVANEELGQQNEEILSQRDEIESQRNALVEQKDKVERIHLEIDESIDYATRLQNAVLSDPEILNQHVSDHFVLFKPKQKVSGDFYWWTHIEGQTIITAADCTGHGVPGAFMSMLGISFLREIVQKEYVTHTGVILRKLRKEIIKTLKQKGDLYEQKDGMDMAIVSIDHENQVVQFSGANNPLYIFSDSKLKNLTSIEGYDDFYEVKPDKMPISIYDRMDKFTVHDIQLKKGDRLFMFSDGFADQFGGPRGKKFKYKAFKHLLWKTKTLSMVEQKKILNNAFEDWKGEADQIDDVVVVGIEL